MAPLSLGDLTPFSNSDDLSKRLAGLGDAFQKRALCHTASLDGEAEVFSYHCVCDVFAS